jgi:hypothetical protein
MRDTGLMPHIDDSDAGCGRIREHFIEVISDECEYLGDSDVLQSFDKQMGAGWHWQDISSLALTTIRTCMS